MKKLIALLFILMMLTGCTTTYTDGTKSFSLFPPKYLAKLQEEPINIDITEDFDPASVLTEVQEGTEISYELDEENSKVSITLTKDDKVETLESEVTIEYPQITIPEDITIDTYTGYDINELVEADPDLEVTSELNEETGELTITYTKGNYSQTVTKEVEIIDTNPKPTVLAYRMTNNVDYSWYEKVWFRDDGVLEITCNGIVYDDEWYDTVDEHHGTHHNANGIYHEYYISDDYSYAEIYIGAISMRGKDGRYYGNLITE